MIEVGSMVQSKYRLSNSGKEGNLGLVVKLGGSLNDLAQVYYPKTRTFGWVKSKDMKVVA